jgi:hypothetical protein
MNYVKKHAKIKKMLRYSISHNKIERAVKILHIVDVFEQFNSNFKDIEIEEILKSISSILFEKINYTPIEKHYVFCDSLAWDNHGLTQQYLRAFMAQGADILYLITTFGRNKRNDILKELCLYSKAKVVDVSKERNYVKKATIIYNEIKGFRASKAFLHSFSAIDAIVFYQINSCTKYRINLGDHLFWVGVDATDYLIEFRDFGYTISLQKREFPQNKILKQPFYPILSTGKFEGFPVDKKEKVLMFSGGAMYKIEDERDTFFNIMKTLLIENPTLVIFFAGRGDDSKLKKFIKKNNLQNQLFSIGYRRDISEVFKQIDIYLQTFPMGGGLMTLYALSNGKPVIGLTNNSVHSKLFDYEDDISGIVDGYKLSFCEQDQVAFYELSRKLITNKKYREDIGAKTKNMLVDSLKFNKSIQDLLENGNTRYTLSEAKIDYEKLNKEYVLINEMENTNDLLLLKELRIYAVIMFPELIFSYITNLFNFLRRKLRRINNEK